MTITARPYLLKRRKKPSGEIPVYIRLTQNRSYSLIATDISVKQSHWDGRNEWRKWIKTGKHGHPSAKALNKKLAKKIEEINSIIEEGGDNISRKQVARLLQGGGRYQVYEYGVDLAETLLEEGKYHPYKQMRAAVSKFKDFAGDVRFNDVTPQMLNDFQRWMKNEGKSREKDKKGNHSNTIVKTIGRLKAVFEHAYAKDITTNLPFQDPKFKREKSEQGVKHALSVEQIEKIESLSLEPGNNLWHARNFFMFSFWNAGIRFTDLAFLRWENIKDGRLVYQMGKNKKNKDIKLLPQALEILDHYCDDTKTGKGFIFPILPEQKMTEAGYRRKAASKNALINRDLKQIQVLAGIQTNISFHTSRHSFARWASSNKKSMDFIGKALAHSKRTTTERYLNSLSEYNIDDEMEELANDWNNKK